MTLIRNSYRGFALMIADKQPDWEKTHLLRTIRARSRPIAPLPEPFLKHHQQQPIFTSPVAVSGGPNASVGTGAPFST
jgi:hypothetical protein